MPLGPTRTIDFETEEGTWLSLDITPDGQRIIFDLLGDLYIVDSTGGRAQALTRGMAIDSQPVFSPDGSSIAFISDRSGAENLWLMQADGSAPRQLTFRENAILVSPEWSSDGRSIFASIYRADLNAYSLWQFEISGEGEGKVIVATRSDPNQGRDSWLSATDPAPSPNGQVLYFAAHTGAFKSDSVPEWTIRQLDLASGEESLIVSAPRSPRPDLSLGTYFRPVIAPNGRYLVYGTRHDGQTGLRLLDLESRQDRWLVFPVVRDQAEASHWRGMLPRYSFTPDGEALILNRAGHIARIELASGEETLIPFVAKVSIELGPDLHVPIRQESGPVRSRLIQTPESSPDGKMLAFSALTHIYLMSLQEGAKPRRLTSTTLPSFNPSWSRDGQFIVYVSWTARDAGHIWLVPATGAEQPRRLTASPAFYSSPVFTPDGTSIVALRSSNVVRMHTFMDYGLLRDAELVVIPLDGSSERVVGRGKLGGKPGFTMDPATVHIVAEDGLNAIPLDGGERRRIIQVVGPGWYFAEGPAPVDDLKISPNGRWALVQIAQQLHVVAVPQDSETIVDLSDPAVPSRKLTTVGADFFEWTDGGDTISWAVGSTWYRRPFGEIELHAPHSPDHSADVPAESQVEAFEAVVEVPRDRPDGSLLLTGATAITMADRPDDSGPVNVIRDADVLIVNDRIKAIGPRGQIKIPDGTEKRDVSGRYIVPGFINTHDHVAEIRRGIIDLETWAPAASLAYGVTTKFDPSTLSIDMLAYEDLIDAGMITGSRIHSTATALFSFNEFESKDQVVDVLKRYRDHYKTFNIKMYRSGNRRVRQWVAMASADLGMMPTAEGALALKLDLSQIVDGFVGQEHALPVAPLYRDVVTLMARSGVSYTTTLMITNGGPEGQDYFIVRDDPVEDPKLNRFWPRYAIDIKMRQRTWRTLADFFFPAVAASVASIQRAGGLIGIGAHGEAPGLGFHWEMQAHQMGGMTPLEVLRAATIGGAKTIGRAAEFGSLEVGKYADLVILEKNPMDNIRNSLSISHVMKNGRLYEAKTLDEIWPRQLKRGRPWFWDDTPVPVTYQDDQNMHKEMK